MTTTIQKMKETCMKNWWDHDNYNSENERNVHEELRPDTKLDSLTIEHYRGTRFPN